jgi:hypothetical protein
MEPKEVSQADAELQIKVELGLQALRRAVKKVYEAEAARGKSSSALDSFKVSKNL